MFLTGSPKKLHYLQLSVWRKKIEDDPAIVEAVGTYLNEPYNSPQDVGKLILHLDTRIAMMQEGRARQYHEPLSQKVSALIISGEYEISDELRDEWDVHVVNGIVWVLKGCRERIIWNEYLGHW